MQGAPLARELGVVGGGGDVLPLPLVGVDPDPDPDGFCMLPPELFVELVPDEPLAFGLPVWAG